MKFRILIICFITFFCILNSVSVRAEDGIDDNNTWLNCIFPSENFRGVGKNGFINVNYGNTEISYPAVDDLEKRILGNVYSHQNIYARLDRLEKTVFGNVINASLSERVDKLKEVAPGSYAKNDSNSNITLDQSYQENDDYGYNSTGYYSSLLYDLEKEYLGTVYVSEPNKTRITRLENVLFSQPAEGYSEEERIQRLFAYAESQKSSSEDDYYGDLGQLSQYNNVMKGAQVLSILFMILQFFL